MAVPFVFINTQPTGISAQGRSCGHIRTDRALTTTWTPRTLAQSS